MHILPLSVTNPAKIQSRRIDVIDALRGFTLVGILITHSFHYYFDLSGVDPSGATLNFFEQFMAKVVSHLFDGTLYAIFSFLFGISFAIQLKNADSRRQSFKGLFLWRLFILLIIGCLHRLFFSADILRLYAVLGTVLLLCTYLNNKQILILSILLFMMSVGVRIYYGDLPEVVDPKQGSVAHLKFLQVFGLYKIDFLIRSGRLFLIPSLFILGLYAGKIKFFHDNHFSRKLNLKLFLLTSGILTLTTAAYLAAKYSGIPLPAYAVESVTIIEKTMLYFIFVTLIVILYRIKPWHQLLAWLVPIGKMGLTMYISQSLFLVAFYSIEVNMLSKLGLSVITVITLLFVVLQRQFAKYWGQHYRYGPIEYVWRKLTYIRGTTLASSAKDIGSKNASRNFRPNSKCLSTETEREA